MDTKVLHQLVDVHASISSSAAADVASTSFLPYMLNNCTDESEPRLERIKMVAKTKNIFHTDARLKEVKMELEDGRLESSAAFGKISMHLISNPNDVSCIKAFLPGSVK